MLPGVGVFGTSLTARVIIPLLKDEGFAVKALWGRTQEEAEELAKEMSVPFYTSRIDEVLLHQDVDLVCINLPPPLTRQIAVKTLDPRVTVTDDTALGQAKEKACKIAGKNPADRGTSGHLKGCEKSCKNRVNK
ncbi:Glucose-fructose oxidoreductase domain-containing protein 1 [Myotis brandtii]|uniref:Glucose-fructose oxidoreductase domain-containing protein 1 n=1 Tax=Myotis brandtii TaxID=109478 RepID=S7PWA3_MYOBR|nr:Glucose-fructose oxidoreductase domain-containing protein 1 [Myotis brandtii]